MGKVYRLQRGACCQCWLLEGPETTQCPGQIALCLPPAGQVSAVLCVTVVGWSCTACQMWEMWKWSWRRFVVFWEQFGWRCSSTGQLPFKYIYLSHNEMLHLMTAQLCYSRCEFTFLTNKDWCIFIKWPSTAEVGKQWGGYRGSEAAIEPSHH